MLDEFPFVGRSQELKSLLGVWADVCQPGNGPRMVTVLGEPGYGKTRLIREFYRRIAAEHRHQSNDYWPDSLPQSGDRMDINPQLHDAGKEGEMPWLWWGIRCEPNETRNGTQDEGCALIRSSAHLMQHTGALERKRDRMEKLGKLKAAGITQLLKLAEEIPVVGTAIRQYSSGREWLELYRSAVEAARPAAAQSPGLKMQLDVRNACEACLEICQSFIDPTDENLPTIPMVLVIDDAHAADPLTIKCVYRILHFAHSRKLTLLVVATHWAKEWKSADRGVPANLTMTESWKSFRQISSALPMRPGTEPNSVFHELECEGVDCGLILDRLELALGERLRKHCLDFADGNPQLLRELLSFLHECRAHRAKDWWFQNPAPDLQLSERGFEQFGQNTKSKEEFLKHRAEEVQKDPHLSSLLQLGALQGHSFLGRFTSEVWSDIGDLPGAGTGPLELLRSAETPHHVIRLSGVEGQLAKFRHRTYRDAFLSIDPAKRQVLLDAITAKTVAWLEFTPDDPSNTDFFVFASNWFREINDRDHLEKALAVRAGHLIQLGRPSIAAELLEERLNMLVEIHGPKSPEAKIAELKFGEALVEAGRFAQALRILEPLRLAFAGHDELWVDSSRTLARALQKKSESEGTPKQSFVNWMSGRESSTAERDRAAEILREVWAHQRQRLEPDSLDVLLAGLEYANALTEGGQDHALKADQGILVLPCCAVLLEKFGDNDTAKEIALMILGSYLAAWRWPKRMSISPHSDFPQVAAFYEEHHLVVATLKAKYPEASDVFGDLRRHRSALLGQNHPATIEARRLELEESIHISVDDRITQFRALANESESSLGSHHPQTIECKAALADRLRSRDDTRFEAAVLLRQILDEARSSLGQEHPYTLTIENKIRNILPTL